MLINTYDNNTVLLILVVQAVVVVFTNIPALLPPSPRSR